MKPKLIRDKVPELAQSSGDTLITEKLDEAAYLHALKAKLIEEAQEVSTADVSNLPEELADVLEVVLTLAEASVLPFEKIEEARAEKLEKSGGFTQRLLLVGKEA